MSKYLKTYKDKLNFVIIMPIIFLSIELIARMYNWYYIIPIYDLLSHTLFGMSFYAIYWYKFHKNKSKKGLAFHYYIIIALLWELLESVGDIIFINSSALKDIFFFDGITDILIGCLGLYIASKLLE